MHYDLYIEKSNFLADINNEKPEKNQRYKDNLSSLENFVMYMWEDESSIVPKESSVSKIETFVNAFFLRLILFLVVQRYRHGRNENCRVGK